MIILDYFVISYGQHQAIVTLHWGQNTKRCIFDAAVRQSVLEVCEC